MPEREQARPLPDGFVRIAVVVDVDTLDRYVYAGERRGLPAARLIAETLRDDARHLPARPVTGRRPQQEVRDASRERRGGVSAHTEALRVIPPRADGADGRAS